MARMTWWPTELRAFGPDASPWHLVDVSGAAPADRFRVDDQRVRLGSAPSPEHAVTTDELVARQWTLPIGSDRSAVRVELGHTVVVRPGRYAVWVDQVTSSRFHRYTSALTIAGTLTRHDWDVRHVVVRAHDGWVKLCLAADYDATITDQPGRVRVDLHLRGHNTRFLVAAFAGSTQDELEPCALRVADGPVVEVTTPDTCEWVLHSNRLRRPVWIGPCQTDARWAVLDHAGRIALAHAT